MLMRGGQECADWLAHCQPSQKTGEWMRGWRTRGGGGGVRGKGSGNVGKTKSSGKDEKGKDF